MARQNSFVRWAGGKSWFIPFFEKITKFYDFIDDFNGKTFADKIASLVKSLGVTDAEIKSIKRILLG